MNIDKFNQIKDSFGFGEGISGREEFFNSVVLVLIMPIKGEYHLVFQKRASHIRQGGEICFPGGKIDEGDETLEQVAIRETKEEMGIAKDKITVIGRLNTIVTPAGVTVDAFIGIADITMEEIKINECEVESFFTIPISFFTDHEPERFSAKVKIHSSYTDPETGEEIILLPVEKLGLPEKYKKPWGNFQYGIYVYHTEQGLIWGITSRIIHDFVDRIMKFNN